jgi:hypothetical protein
VVVNQAMHILQEVWSSEEPPIASSTGKCDAPELVLCFAARARLSDPVTWERLRGRFPGASIVAGSTAGEIAGTRVLDDTVVVTALHFEKSSARAVRLRLGDQGDAQAVGKALARELTAPGLVHVLVFSDGLKVNGSALVQGMTGELPSGVAVTGGLCGDGALFERTFVCLDEFDPAEAVVAIGLYGEALRISCGSLGGWDAFGPERRITRSEGNVLFEVDGKPALDLYEQYLGEHAAGLPSSGLLFPMTVRASREDIGVVRTILAVDRVARTLTFAGDVPVGYFARLMRANFDHLLDGAAGAARVSHETFGAETPELALLVSCVGRKLVLKQRIEEEVEAVERVLGKDTVLAGFYSYGEISPFTPGARCELHNQTMTVTTISEK